MKALTEITIIEAIDDKLLFAPLFSGWFKDAQSWSRWHVFLRAIFGLPMSDADLVVLKECTGLDAPPEGGADEGWLICGRRSGKSRTVALCAAYLATMIDWNPYLSAGEPGVIMVVATNKRQAGVIFKYVREFLQIKLLAPLIVRETQETIELANGIVIDIQPASFRTIRGFTVVAGLLDEVAMWSVEDGSANPDREIISAIRPAMATIKRTSQIGAAKSPKWKCHRIRFDDLAARGSATLLACRISDLLLIQLMPQLLLIQKSRFDSTRLRCRCCREKHQSSPNNLAAKPAQK